MTEAINIVRESEIWEDKYNRLLRTGEEEDNARKLSDREFDKRIIKTAKKMYRN